MQAFKNRDTPNANKNERFSNIFNAPILEEKYNDK
jgi:hypothetical protein